MMRKRLNFWLPFVGVASLLGACGSDGVGGSTATVQERIDRCHDDFASCDDASEECEASAMGCMNGVRGNGVPEDHIAGECDALYDLCSTKTEDLVFCEDLRQTCFDCVDRYDDDDDSDGDTDTDDDGRDDDEDTDDDGRDDDDDEDTDDDGRYDDEDTDEDDHDRCDRDHGEYDDDEDTDDEDTDYDYDDGDCNQGGSGGSAGTG